MREPLAQVSPDTLLVVDIDDTLLCYGDHLGSTPWFEENASSPHFQQIAGLLADHLSVQPVESDLPAWIEQLQESGVQVVGLTGRETTHPAVSDWLGKTTDQLEQAGFYLPRVVFGGRKHKAAAFGALLVRLQPTKVMVIDDRFSDLEALIAVAKEHGIECQPCWYRARALRPYDSRVAAAQLEALLDQVCVGLEKGDGQRGALFECGKEVCFGEGEQEAILSAPGCVGTRVTAQ